MAKKLFKLSTVLEFQSKSRRKAGEGLSVGRYPFFTSSQQQTKWLDKADYTTESIILGTGGVANIHFSKEFSTSADVFILTPRDKNISAKYIYHYLSGNKYILERGFKGVGLKHLSREYTEKIDLPLPVRKDGTPDFLEQERIVEILDKTEALKVKRADADAKTAEIIPALYASLFKDKKFSKGTIKELVPSKESIRTGPFGSDLLHSEFTEIGIPVLGIDNAVSNGFEWGKVRCIPEEKYKKFKRFRVYPADVLITIMGTVGRVCVAPSDLPESMSSKHLCVVTPDKNRINPYYLWAALLFDDEVRHQTRQVAKGAIMEGWNSTIIKNLVVSVPPMALQNKFAEMVQAIEAQRKKQRDSADEIKSLSTALISSVFVSEI